MTPQPYYTTVPASGAILLPPEFFGKTIRIETESKEDSQLQRLQEADREFRQPRTLDEILKAQGPKVIYSLEELLPDEPAWESQEEFFEFLEAIGEDIDLYR